MRAKADWKKLARQKYLRRLPARAKPDQQRVATIFVCAFVSIRARGCFRWSFLTELRSHRRRHWPIENGRRVFSRDNALQSDPEFPRDCYSKASPQAGRR